MERLVPVVIGAFLGAFLKYLHERYADRSEPICSILRVALTTTVPEAAREVVAGFPDALALRYNTSPVLPGAVNSAREIPLKIYAKQVHDIRETVRVQLGVQERGLRIIASLFTAVDRDDHVGFVTLFAEHDSFLWGWLRGRALRGDVPPEIPPAVVDAASIAPRNGVSVRADKDGDYVVVLAGHVQLVLLEWSSKVSIPELGERCQKVAGGVARSIAEFRVDELRALLGALHRDVSDVTEQLRGLLADIASEEARYSFLEVTALMRNRGRRAFAVDSVGRLFVSARGYSFAVPGSNTAQHFSDDIDIDLLCEEQAGTREFVIVKPGDATVVRFLTRVPFDSLPARDALEALGKGGERTCRLGSRLFKEGMKPALYYTPTASFRMFDAGTTIPRPD